MEETINKISELCGGLDDADKNLIRAYLELKEENKELKEDKENLIRADKKKTEHIDELEEENRNLKNLIDRKDREYIRRLKQSNEDLKKENDKLKDVLESLMKKYKIREVGIGDEIIMKTLGK